MVGLLLIDCEKGLSILFLELQVGELGLLLGQELLKLDIQFDLQLRVVWLDEHVMVFLNEIKDRQNLIFIKVILVFLEQPR